jgi:hypothetical protein
MKNNAPTLYTLGTLREAMSGSSREIDGEWVPARPYGLFSVASRLRLAFGVFTGRWDAFEWPKGQ